LHQRRDGDRQPQHAVDPIHVGRDDRPLDDDDGGEDRRHDDVRAPPVEPSERAGQHQHRDETGRALREVHDRERVRADALEEQGVDAALTDRQPRGRDEQQADDRTDQATLARTDAEDAPESVHALRLALRRAT
jgi:hypothetical protein